MLQALDHVTIRSADLAPTLVFYQRLLGLRPGPRPPFRFPGLWMYAGRRAVVHVLEGQVAGQGGAIDHVAFEVRGRSGFSRRLDEAAVPFTLQALPDGSALQMFLRDPDGARIELLFKDPEDR